MFVIHANIPVNAIRGRESEYSLEECGFEIHNRPSSCQLVSQTFENVEGRELVWQYLKETIAVAEETLKASKVLCFDWRVCECNLKHDIYQDDA